MKKEVKLDIDSEMIKDFFDEFDDMYELIDSSVNKAREEEEQNQKVENKKTINEIFRGVHSIKSNLRMVSLPSLSDVVHTLENLLEQIRREKIPYNTQYGDITLLVLEETRIIAEEALKNGILSDELTYIAHSIDQLCTENENHRKQALDVTLKLLDPFNNKNVHQIILDDAPEIVEPATAQELDEKEIEIEIEIENQDELIEEDLEFFKRLSVCIEERTDTRRGRTKLVISIIKKMNELSGNIVPDIQLEVAVLLADWGLAVMTKDLQEKLELNDYERQLMNNYTNVSASILNNNPTWATARRIILESREKVDGSGYPNGLKEADIHPGALMLSLANAFAAILQSRPYKQLSSRTVMAAIMEINNSVGSQFSSKWTDFFNKAIKELHEQRKIR